MQSEIVSLIKKANHRKWILQVFAGAKSASLAVGTHFSSLYKYSLQYFNNRFKAGEESRKAELLLL